MVNYYLSSKMLTILLLFVLPNGTVISITVIYLKGARILRLLLSCGWIAQKRGIITFQMLSCYFFIYVLIVYIIMWFKNMVGWWVLRFVNKGLEVRLYPDDSMVHILNQNIGNARFTWNHLLDEYQKTYVLFKQHGYNSLKCNMTTFNTMLNMLKKRYGFLYLSESNSLQQVYRDLLNAFKKFFNEGAGYPCFRSK